MNPDRNLIAEIRGPIAQMEFKECPECARKPGSPALCASCLNNRRAITHMASCLIRCIPGLEIAAARAERPAKVRAKENFEALIKLCDEARA